VVPSPGSRAHVDAAVELRHQTMHDVQAEPGVIAALGALLRLARRPAPPAADPGPVSATSSSTPSRPCRNTPPALTVTRGAMRWPRWRCAAGCSAPGPGDARRSAPARCPVASDSAHGHAVSRRVAPVQHHHAGAPEPFRSTSARCSRPATSSSRRQLPRLGDDVAHPAQLRADEAQLLHRLGLVLQRELEDVQVVVDDAQRVVGLVHQLAQALLFARRKRSRAPRPAPALRRPRRRPSSSAYSAMAAS
jgi:hypothetical protein